MMLSPSVSLLGILPSLTHWFLSNLTPLGISSCSGSTFTIWFRIPISLCPQMPQIMPKSLISSSIPLSTSLSPTNSMRSPPPLLHPHPQSLPLTPELLSQPLLLQSTPELQKRHQEGYLCLSYPQG